MRITQFLLGLLSWGLAATCHAQAPTVAGVWEGEAQTRPWTSFLTLTLPEGGEGQLRLGGQALPAIRTDGAPGDIRLRLGSTETSPHLVLRVAGDGLTGELVLSGRTAAVRLRRVAAYPTPANRDEAWLQDLDALKTRFLVADRTFDAVERQAFLARVAQLEAGVTELSDAEIIMGMASAIAVGGNAHTRLYLLRNRTELRRLPIRVWNFEDGTYVVRATADHVDLLGCRVMSMGGMPIDEARARVAPAFAGNGSWAGYMSTYTLTSPEALEGMGVLPDDTAAEWRFDQCATSSARLAALSLEKSAAPTESWWDLAPDRSSDLAGWSHVLRREPPMYLRATERNYRFTPIEDAGLIYVQFNRAAEMRDETLKDFGARLMTALEAPGAPGVILDLRFNTGGNLELARPLMAAIEEKTRGRKRYVIIGRATFSAGLAPAAVWREAGQTVFVGEPAGDDLDYWAEGGNIVLPNSGLFAHFANGAHSYSPAPCPADVPCLDLNSPPLGPDLSTPLTWAQYMAGVDPALDAIRTDARP